LKNSVQYVQLFEIKSFFKTAVGAVGLLLMAGCTQNNNFELADENSKRYGFSEEFEISEGEAVIIVDGKEDEVFQLKLEDVITDECPSDTVCDEYEVKGKIRVATESEDLGEFTIQNDPKSRRSETIVLETYDFEGRERKNSYALKIVEYLPEADGTENPTKKLVMWTSPLLG
jgi:hypothetical protein